jgi:hypothetical protein
MSVGFLVTNIVGPSLTFSFRLGNQGSPLQQGTGWSASEEVGDLPIGVGAPFFNDTLPVELDWATTFLCHALAFYFWFNLHGLL